MAPDGSWVLISAVFIFAPFIMSDSAQGNADAPERERRGFNFKLAEARLAVMLRCRARDHIDSRIKSSGRRDDKPHANRAISEAL
jgi:hypothetical protein